MANLWKFGWILLLAGLFVLAVCSSDQTSSDGGPECSLDTDCSSGKYCVSGKCVDCRYKSDCNEGDVCQDGSCVKDCPPDNRCQSGGTCCPGNYECVDKVCRPPCDGTRCGHRSELCCNQSQVCEDERCLINCGGNERCGLALDSCCQAGQICYGSTCTFLGIECIRQSDCPPGQICERDLGRCIDEGVVGDCLYVPPEGEFNPEVDCRWTPPAGGVTPVRNDVVMAPVVGNLTDDNADGKTDRFDVPEIVFTSYDLEGDGCCNENGTLRIVSGACNPDGSMTTIFSSSTPAIDNSGGLAIGDLDGDGVPEIVAIRNNGGSPQGTVAFKRTADDGSAWTVMWENTQYPTWNVHTRGGAQPALADLDGQAPPEVIIGNVVLNGNDGSLRWDGLVTVGPNAGIGNNAFLGPVTTVADIDLDGRPEVLAGNTCYNYDGSEKWTFNYTSNNSPCGGSLPCDGYNAVGNFDGDPEGEVVIIRRGEVFVINDDGSLLKKVAIPLDDCANNESGPPTIADFDGDGRPEIGTAAADYYVIIDLDCYGNPLPDGCAREGVLWFVPNEDCSSRVTASSVFDFDGNGRAEAVYADETSFRIFDGLTGAELYVDNTHGSHTRLEMVVIADVDNDGNAEVVIAENSSMGGTPGVEVWGDTLDNWVFTRRIWNQHSYHVTNISEDGIVPLAEEPNWRPPHSFNNFRQNVQGEGIFWAPDLVVINLGAVCEADNSLYITFDVMNQGSRMVGPGASIAIYIDDQMVHTMLTTKALFPGQLEHFNYSWVLPANMYDVIFDLRVAADDVGDGSGQNNECDEDNNTATLTGLACGTVD
ncbi:MAG: hypothetical protein JRJ87_18815 [Deltaproteobacteria bacterium]|nr:hypothetical protein [Deltaproteobacteria bacterium]